MKKFYFLLVILLLVAPISNSKAQEVDILWQAETYAPPFYKGKALWSNESKITLLAIPRGAGTGNPASLTYKWTKNGTVLGNINGVGKNTIAFTDSIISRSQTIQVDIISAEQGKIASASLTLASAPPSLAIYENNPLYGFMFHKEVGGVHELQGEEVTFAAFPFFFSVPSRLTSEINYQWLTNRAGAPDTGSSVTYRVPEGATGSSEISVGVSNKNKILQSSSKSFLIKFGK